MNKLITVLISVLMLSSCTVIDGFFDGRQLDSLRDDTDTESVVENIQWAIERLGEEDEYAPDTLATLIPLATDKALDIDLLQLNPNLFNQLIERYLSIAKEGVQTGEPDDWDAAGFPYNITNDYLRTSAAYNLGRLKGDSISSQLLVLLRKVDSPALQAVVLKSMNDRVDVYKANPEIRAQAISALSSVDINKLTANSVLANQLYTLESELVTLPTINRILSKIDIYQLEERNLNYILDLNEGIILYQLKNPSVIKPQEVQMNARLLASLALPAVEHLDGTVPIFSSVQKGAQRILLQYMPGIYYYSMSGHAKTSDYTYGQLLATRQYMERYEAYSLASPDKLVALGDDDAPFYNHHVLMNAAIYRNTEQSSKKMIFSSLYKRVESRPTDYVDFIYSYLNVNYPQDFANYLLRSEHRTYKTAQLDALQHYYALILTQNEAVKESTKQKLIAKASAAQLTRSLKYSDRELDGYAKRVYPTFVTLHPSALLAQLSAKHQSVQKQAGVHQLVDYYLAALDGLEVSNRTKYLNFGAAVIAEHNIESSKKILGSYHKIPLDKAVNSLNNIGYRSVKKMNPEELVYLGNYITSRKTELTNSLVNQYGAMFNRSINGAANDDAALMAAQQGMVTLESMRPTLYKSVSQRFNGVEL